MVDTISNFRDGGTPLGRAQSWAHRLSWLALVLTLGGVATALVAAIGSGAGAWPFGTGLTILRCAFSAAMAGGVVALLALLVPRWRGTGARGRNIVSALLAVLFSLYLGNQISTARSVPAIHDVATNLDDLPQFSTLPVRADNLENVPDDDRPELAALDPESRWKALHRQAYGGLKPRRLAVSPADALRRAGDVARDAGWTIAKVDPRAGTLEATATTLFFRFRDDVVVRVRPDPARPGGSLVDMRSISRVGGSDVGVNARRIRAFLNDLASA